MTERPQIENDAIELSHTGPVATIQLSRPENRNALTPSMVGSLAATLTVEMETESTRVIVLTNAGTTFCAGADLSGSKPGYADPTDADHNPKASFADLLRIITTGPKPVVGRINGHAMGGGVGLVAACDISLMNSESQIGFTEVRLGVAPSIISVVCLPKISRADAADFFLTGRRISADRAEQAGLINQSVDKDQLDAEVDAVVGLLLQGGPAALTAAKDLIYRIPTMGQAEGLEWASNLTNRLFAGPEAEEGVSAFRERRKPSWVP